MRQRAVIFGPRAESDLGNIYNWIAGAGSPKTALSYIARVEEWCMALDVATERGRRRDDIRPGLRVLSFERRLSVAVVVEEETVTILRILHGAQDWESVLI